MIDAWLLFGAPPRAGTIIRIARGTCLQLHSWVLLSEAIPALETVAGVAVRRWLISKRSLIVGFRGILSLLARVSTWRPQEGTRQVGRRTHGQLVEIWLISPGRDDE